jgi:hypothetical protein
MSAPEPVSPEKILLFFGSGRTGSTMLGQILNHHPNCLIATESRLVHRLLAGEGSLDELVAKAAGEARRQFEEGLENTERFAPTVGGGLQPRWRSFHEIARNPAYAKREIRVVGDKKAGANAQALIDHPAWVENLFARDPRLVMLQLVRDPARAATSGVKHLGIESFDAACEQVVTRTTASWELGRRLGNRAMCVWYEELCDDPRPIIERIVAWLGLEASGDWLDQVAKRVSRGEQRGLTPTQRSVCDELLCAGAEDGPMERYRSGPNSRERVSNVGVGRLEAGEDLG